MLKRLTTYGLAAVGATAALASTAWARDPVATVEFSAPMGTFNGKQYVYVEGKLTGTVDREEGDPGTYTAPIVMIYPADGSTNGVGVVDWAVAGNWFLFIDAEGNPVVCPRGSAFCEPGEGEVAGHRNQRNVIQYSRTITEEFLMDQGFTYMSVQWDKLVTDSMGSEVTDGTNRRRLTFGTIETADDAFEILRDAADYMRAPNVAGLDVEAPGAAAHVVAWGFSQTGMFQRGFMRDGHNLHADESLVYDGFVVAEGGTMCWIRLPDFPFSNFEPCFGPPNLGEAKVIAIHTQSELDLLAGFFARDPENAVANYRVWEVPGVAHLPTAVLDLSHMGATVQNPAHARGVFKAAFFHMKAWLQDGTEPPPNQYIDGTVDEAGTFTATVDADGNATGGIRMPHMPSVVDGQDAGAPTGTYLGIDPASFAMMPFNLDIAAGGSYVRFSDEELMTRYPTEDVYRARVTAAADALLAAGYIMEEDRDYYAAGSPDIPDPPDLPDPDDEDEEEGGSCSAGGRGSLSGMALLGLALFFVGRRRRGGK